jgi:hypothetical protein
MTLRTNTAECTEPTFVMTTGNNPYVAASSQAGWPTRGPLAFDPGLPFGRYDMCLEYWDSSGTPGYRHYATTTSTAAYDNTAALGLPGSPADTPSTWASTTGTGWSSKQSSRYC